MDEAKFFSQSGRELMQTSTSMSAVSSLVLSRHILLSSDIFITLIILSHQPPHHGVRGTENRLLGDSGLYFINSSEEALLKVIALSEKNSIWHTFASNKSLKGKQEMSELRRLHEFNNALLN